MTAITGFRRENGEIGIRDLRLALPSVVCATRSAWFAAKDLDGAVAIEHPVGCAQIGADKEQTFRTLVGVGAHANVGLSVVLGLGCEGIAAKSVADGIAARGRSPHMLTIQAAGGMGKAAAAARQLLAEDGATHQRQRTRGDLSEIVLGVAASGEPWPLAEAIARLFLEAGGRVLKASREVGDLAFAETMTQGACYAEMNVGEAGDAEVLTGLAAGGAHLIVAAGDMHRLGTHAIAPTLRICLDKDVMAAMRDEFDGLAGDRTPERWLSTVLDVIAGQKTAQEEIGASVFSIARSGPTL